MPLKVFQELLVPEVDLLDLVEGEVDGQVRLQEVQVVDWNKFWIIGSQQIVAHVEKCQREEVEVEVGGDVGQLVVGQVQRAHALKGAGVVGPGVDVVVG